MVGVPDGEKSLKMFTEFQYNVRMLIIDTPHDGIGCDNGIASCGKNVG